MAKTEQNLKLVKDFIREVLKKNFSQDVKDDDLEAAAEKLCEAIPAARQAA